MAHYWLLVLMPWLVGFNHRLNYLPVCLRPLSERLILFFFYIVIEVGNHAKDAEPFRRLWQKYNHSEFVSLNTKRENYRVDRTKRLR
ncbi:hypothetical protein THOG11_20291 [Vibrio harveyi]|nr:hypothetical protein TH15OA1_530109 [Vibrio harveyi]CAH1556503.1 hypothetical protein THOD03_20288 [Vibrio harveyi]CAH1563505.1 hypothetical protein THOG11_20291 [Vibrio harveyi]